LRKKKLPIGIQTFRDIVDKKENYTYVDKTGIAYNLIDNGKYYFLSRPRRFGKSLFIDTLKCIFEGKKELFEDLEIYDKWDWSETFPVIKIDFNDGELKTKEGIESRVFDILDFHQEKFGIKCKKERDIASCFKDLIVKVSEKYNKKVVILIDEYDKPILENIIDKKNTDNPMSETARNILRVFYGVIKGADEYLKFVMLTGVSKFSKMNLFSGLNNLDDITIDSLYATITGYTHIDLQETFSDYLEDVDLELVKKWYNGYNYFGEPIYNPFDILLFLSKGCEFENYWWETGNPKFLIDILKTQDYYLPDLENIIVSKEQLNSFDIEKIDLIALLWQTGYLTFNEKIKMGPKIRYKMKIPNLEIQNSLNSLFFNYLTNLDDSANSELLVTESLFDNDFEKLERTLKAIFASIPYHNYVNNNILQFEGYYSSIIFTFFASLGFDIEIIPEEATNRGRIDLTIKTDDSIYIFEFKVDIKEKALKQIKDRKYNEKYLNDDRDIYMIGICFDSEEKNITEFEWEKTSKKKT